MSREDFTLAGRQIPSSTASPYRSHWHDQAAARPHYRLRPCAVRCLSLPQPARSSRMPTSVLSETEGPLRPSPTAFFGHPGRHSVAAEAGSRRGLHSPKILAPNLHRTDSVLTASSLSALATRQQPAHAACPISLPASNASPLFHTAKVMAAILRATVTRASSGRSPRSSNSPCHDLKGSHREAVSAALLKTYFSVRLWLRVKPRVSGALFLRRTCSPINWWSPLD